MQITIDGLGGPDNGFVRLTRDDETWVTFEAGYVGSRQVAIKTGLMKVQVRVLSFARKTMDATPEPDDTPS